MRRVLPLLCAAGLSLWVGYILPIGRNSCEVSNSPLFQTSLASTKERLIQPARPDLISPTGREIHSETCDITCNYTCSTPTCGSTCLPTCISTCARTCSQVTCISSCGAVTCEITCMETCQATCVNTCNQVTCANTCVATCAWTCASTQISLVSFSAVAQSDRVELHWVTASEISNYGFRLWRCLTETGDFQVIGQVPSRSSGVVITSYVFTDWEVTPGVTYYYQLSDIDISGYENIHPEVVSATPGLPSDYIQHDNFPNPFNPGTTIRFSLPEGLPVILAVYDFRGRLIARLLDEFLGAGVHEIPFDGSDLHSGVYIYRLWAGNMLASGRMTLVK